MFSDFRFALRMLAKTPGFTVVALLTLALAIGANSAIFALIHGVILREVVPHRPEEVFNLFTARQGASREYRQFSHAEYLALREANDTFSHVAAHTAVLAGIGEQEAVRRSFAFFVSEEYFQLLGVTPAAGRFFTAEESAPNSNLPVVVVSHGYWKRLGARSDLIGSTLRINGTPYTVVGVTPKGFSGFNALLAPDVWLPLGQFRQFAQMFGDSSDLDLASPRTFSLNLSARLAPGISPEALEARLPALAQRLDAVQPPDLATSRELQFERPSRFSISTEPSGDSSGFSLAAMLLGMSGCVLLIASLNLANMLLARGSARAKEIAVRLALGATRWRIVRQLVAEGLLLAIGGGGLGLLLALWCNDLLLRSLQTLFSTMNFSLAIDPTPSPAVIGATLGFALLATLLFSVGPAWRAARADLVHDLKQQGTGDSAGARLHRFFAPRQLLVMAQIALSLVLLFAAGLFFRGALAAGGATLGFEPQNQLVAELDYSLGQVPPAEARSRIFAAVDRLAQLPGVEAVGVSTQLPYGNVTNTARFVDAREAASAVTTDPDAPAAGATALFTASSAGYLDALGVRLLRGRTFTDAEWRDQKSPRVAIIDETLAKQLFPNEDALGQRIRYVQPPADGSSAELEIVGICAPHRHDALQRSDRRRVFVPLAHAYQPAVFVHVRLATGERASLLAGISAVRSALLTVDPAMPILAIAPMKTLLERNIQLWIVRLGAVMFALFGGLALLLAAVGVYGVKAYTVARRTREIGIRMAIGAQPRDVFAMIMRQGALQTLTALSLGVVLSLGVGRLLAGFLYQVSPFDPLALVASAVVLAGAALFACFLPARRATRVSPMTALRSE